MNKGGEITSLKDDRIKKVYQTSENMNVHKDEEQNNAQEQEPK